MMAAAAIDMFEFVRSIGKGSYGEVSLARHKRDRKQYVLKRINLKKASARERKSAEQEAKLLSKLKHPNIVSYKDSFEKEGILYIAMQFCEGGDLYNKLKEQKGTLLDERQLVEWFVQIAMALQYMHERNILHRDLKTQNIFLTKSKIIKVGDLGIARVLDNSTDMATTLIGTPYYMSPELFSNKPYNHKSDVWALGCCVYEMMTLKHAFNAKDMNSLVYKILRGKMPPMPKQYTADLVSLLRAMLHQDPLKRPTVNRILRDSYIKKNIAIFLEETKQSRSRPGSSNVSRSHLNRPGSASSVASSRSQGSQISLTPSAYDTPDNASISPSDSARSGADSAIDSARSVVSASDVEVAQSTGQGEPARPVIAQRRKISDNKNLHPIAEGKVVSGSHNDGEDDDGSDNDTLKPSSVKERQAPIPMSPSREVPRRKKKSILSKHVSPNSDNPSVNNSKSVEREKKSAAAIFENPKPVDNPRPLPPPPKKVESEGLPKRSFNHNDKPSLGDSKSSSSSGSKDLDMDTPRSLPNMSAREKRRRNNNAQSYDRPNSARIKLEPVQDSSKSTVITKSERKRYEPQAAPQRHRQPSLVDTSSSDEDTLKENPVQQRNKQQHRDNKEMNNFISLLDNTLQLNREDEKSDEDSQEVKVNVNVNETPRIPKSSSMPSVDTLCNADRLMARITSLHADCIKGVGWDILKEAYAILGRIEEDEVEPKLVELMGKDKFDLYAGKIWQLKFCEDMSRIGIPS